MKTPLGTESLNDTTLVELSRNGDREAFGQIVERYQSLICALTYSACGNLQNSEDLAQVTFITAWCQLPKLKEPGRLKSWLCGIARNVTNNSFRRDKRTPTAHAEVLVDVDNISSDASTPRDHVITKEEEAVLWRSLSELPLAYREPLVLFYRQHQSVAEVAAALDVSEDVARQRLSRGRAMLTEKVTAFIEGALGQTTPDKAFTLGVLAVLPGMTISAKAASLGMTAAKGSATAKAAAATGLLGAILNPLLMVAGIAIGYRMELGAAQSDRDREYVRSFHRQLATLLLGFAIVFAPLLIWARQLIQVNYLLFTVLVIAGTIVYTLTLFVFLFSVMRKRRRIVAEMTPDERATNPETPAWEYRSRFTLLGLPFIHLRICEHLATPTRAWIAVGDYAFGVLFAWGGVAVAPVCFGGCAVGLVPIGVLGIGLLPLAGCSLGVWAIGGLAIGWKALGGCAIAGNAALGGVAVAHGFAQGGLAHATQANNEIAKQFMFSDRFFSFAQIVVRHLAWLNLLWLFPILTWSKARRSVKLAGNLL